MKAWGAYPWIQLSLDAWALGLESSAVVGLRGVKLAAGGPAAAAEARRMVSEKIDAGLSLQARALSGTLGATPTDAAGLALAHYRRRVRANWRRLAKGD